jgi:uncharacterized cupin superfamily protein
MNKPAAPAMPALDPATVAPRHGSGYPAPYSDAVAKREKRALGDAVGLSHFGVNLVRLPPGTASAQRHWHSAEDEFVYILEGEVELVTDAGPQHLTAGMVAGFPAGRPDGDEVEYPGIDLRMLSRNGRYFYAHKDGTPW